MIEQINTLLLGPNGTLIVSVFSFLFVAFVVLAVGLLIQPVIQRRRAIATALAGTDAGSIRNLGARGEIARIRTQRPVESYFKATEKSDGLPDGLELKLFQAGFYSPNASTVYSLTRLVCVAIGFLATLALLSAILPPTAPPILKYIISIAIGAGFIVIPSVMLDYFTSGVKEQYRRGFPDFMDMMITCADAGMSLEAAVGRVSEEMASTHRDLGVQLSIMQLQLRAGKPLREALRDLASRIDLDEARSLAVLFRQSEELGTSLVDALRVYSDEMRGQRILRAEEKANSLPVRMMLPLGLFVFPVVMMIVMLPAVLRMLVVFR